MWYKSSLTLTFYNKKWVLVYTVDQSLIHWLLPRVYLAVGMHVIGCCCCREVKIKVNAWTVCQHQKYLLQRWPLVEVQLYSQNTARKLLYTWAYYTQHSLKTLYWLCWLLYFLWHGTKYAEKTDVTCGTFMVYHTEALIASIHYIFCKTHLALVCLWQLPLVWLRLLAVLVWHSWQLSADQGQQFVQVSG